jgi:transcriptional regulator with XRE-family HTH domain
MTQSFHTPSAAAALLQLARIKSGLSQGQLSERAGVPATMISAYERSRRQPTLPTLMRLLAAAGFDLSMHLVPSDPHDEVLAELESRRGSKERRRRDRQIEAWRRAEPVEVGSGSDVSR